MSDESSDYGSSEYDSSTESSSGSEDNGEEWAGGDAPPGETVWVQAYRGNLLKMRAYLKQGAEPDFKSTRGATPLFIASRNGHLAIVKHLLEECRHHDGESWSIDIDARDDSGTTPLMAAAQGGHVDVAKLLVEHGANINDADDRGCTAFFGAALYNKPAVVTALAEAGADSAAPTAFNASPLWAATAFEHRSTKELLKQMGVKCDAAAFYEKTVLPKQKADAAAEAAAAEAAAEAEMRRKGKGPKDASGAEGQGGSTVTPSAPRIQGF